MDINNEEEKQTIHCLCPRISGDLKKLKSEVSCMSQEPHLPSGSTRASFKGDNRCTERSRKAGIENSSENIACETALIPGITSIPGRLELLGQLKKQLINSSARSSSGYHGLLHTRKPLFQIFQILQNLK